MPKNQELLRPPLFLLLPFYFLLIISLHACVDAPLKLASDPKGPAAQRSSSQIKPPGYLLSLLLVQHVAFRIVLLDERDAFRRKLAEAAAQAGKPTLLFL
jgi:hypothetical protein